MNPNPLEWIILSIMMPCPIHLTVKVIITILVIIYHHQ